MTVYTTTNLRADLDHFGWLYRDSLPEHAALILQLHFGAMSASQELNK
jgi:hypothetical protein